MVVRASAPAVLDTRPHGRDAGPRLARVDSDPDGELGRIDAVLAGDFEQMQRVRRRADERGGAELLHPGEPGWRILPAPGSTIAPRARAPSKPAQNPMKRPNENGKKTRSAGVMPAPESTNPQHRAHHSHDACVSSQRSG